MKVVAIEAGIGAGKSTLLQPLVEKLTLLTGVEWKFVDEPVDTNPEFHRLLKQFIENPNNAEKRIEFQQFITNNRQQLLKGLPDGNYIIERSLYSDIVFCQMNFLSMERPSAHYMSYFYDIIDRLKDYPQIDAVVYLDRTPESCMESIKKRGREGEVYELSYLQDLKYFHDACLPQICRQYGTELVYLNLGNGYADPMETAVAIVRSLNKEGEYGIQP